MDTMGKCSGARRIRERFFIRYGIIVLLLTTTCALTYGHSRAFLWSSAGPYPDCKDFKKKGITVRLVRSVLVLELSFAVNPVVVTGLFPDRGPVSLTSLDLGIVMISRIHEPLSDWTRSGPSAVSTLYDINTYRFKFNLWRVWFF